MNSLYTIERFDLEQAQQGIATGATVVTIGLTVPTGERWLIISAQCAHNDPANPSCYWYITRGGSTRILGDAAALNSGVSSQLYGTAKVADSFILRETDIFGMTAASMAGGKNWTMQAFYEIRRGEVD